MRRYSPTKLGDGAQMATFGDFFATCILYFACVYFSGKVVSLLSILVLGLVFGDYVVFMGTQFAEKACDH